MIQFVIGTRAQLLKVAPVMLECERRGLAWRWVYTAQHRDTMEQLLETFGLPPAAYVTVRWQTEAKSMSTMARWFSRMLVELTRSRRVLGGYTGPEHLVVTHGDTFTTWMAALMGRLTRTKVLHVESGLRSGNLREPFPGGDQPADHVRARELLRLPGRGSGPQPAPPSRHEAQHAREHPDRHPPLRPRAQRSRRARAPAR